MNRLLIAAIFICTVPLYAQGQQPDMAKLKADATKVISIISHDKAKIYCQLTDLGDPIDQEKDRKKTAAVDPKK